jgi:aspartate 1-decarboxylase
MQRVILKSKIHRATVTRADVDYEGSCALGSELLRAADIAVGEQVHIVNVTNGSRAVTYAIEGEPGEVSLNGAMAHIGSVGDVIIIITYVNVDASELHEFAPRIIHVDAQNRVREKAAVN